MIMGIVEIDFIPIITMMSGESLRSTHDVTFYAIRNTHYSIYYTMSWLAIFLIGLGILLLFIEIFLLPGFGAAGVPGLVLIGIGVGVVWHKFGWQIALMYAGGAVVVTVPIAILGLWLAPRTKFGKSLILDTAENRADGFQAPPPGLVELVGKSGRAITPLRPSGAALINGRRVDVVTLGEFIETETEVEVLAVEGNRVVVRSL